MYTQFSKRNPVPIIRHQDFKYKSKFSRNYNIWKHNLLSKFGRSGILNNLLISKQKF